MYIYAIIERHDGEFPESERNTLRHFNVTELANTEKIEVHASSFSDPGPDFCRFIAYDRHGRVIATKQQEGY